MKRISIILIFCSLQYLTVTLNAAEGTLSLSQCSCDLKEALKKGDWQKAYESAENLIKTSPDSPEAGDAYLWLGLYHKSQYDFSKSTKFYQKAADLFPNTWTSAEATARIGCNYYKQNNYSKALEYYRKAASEAKTWQQRKYASAWSKWVHFALAGAGGEEQQLVANCATKSINYYLNSKGIKLDKKKLASSLTLKDGLVPLSRILKSLKKEDVKLNAIKCPLDRINELQLPIVAVVKPSHLIVIKDIEKSIDKKIKVYDPVQGEMSYYEKELAKIWLDKVLTISAPSGRKFALLSKKELNSISLGTCYCCPDPLPPCEDDSDKCCEDGPSPGPGGPGGSGGPGGPGGPGCCSVGFGFPRITVYTSFLSLIVKDTPIGYFTAVGEDVKVSLTFNSDLSYSGIFGNSWHSNLETNIRENEDFSVNVRRSGGRNDTFTYSGGQYNPPVGVSNKLIKNPDETFTLDFTKSHRKYHYDTYSNGGKLLAIEDKNGNTISFQYDASNNLTSITDASGRVTDIQTDTAGRITHVTDPLGREATFVYDANGNLAQVEDMAGNTFIYTYDENNNITSLTEPKGVYSIEYEELGGEICLSSITNPEGNLYQYGGEHPTHIIDPRGNYTWYYASWSYPWYGDTLEVTDALGNYVSYTYDSNRNKTEIMDKRGNITHFSYDTNHNLTSKIDPEGNNWSYTYDTRNNRISTTDPRGKITTYVYDSYNNLLSVTEKAPGGTILSTISYTYNNRGLTTSMTDAKGNLATYNYDTNGNLIQTTDPEGNITTFAYDAIGRKISMTNANDETTSYEYDDLNRITKITHPDSTYIQYTYNCCGLSQQRDENGKITHYEYDSLGRLTKVTDAKGNQTTYTYDGNGNLVSLKDAKGNTTTYTYDALNRPTKITYPLGDSESYTYDEEGNMLTKTDGKGCSAYTYDKNNRLIQIRY
jgi:YD repeat-containing protein